MKYLNFIFELYKALNLANKIVFIILLVLLVACAVFLGYEIMRAIAFKINPPHPRL